MSSDFDFEPVRGLPERLPESERMLWQGAPAWRSLAWRAYRVREVAIYFTALALWQMVSAFADGRIGEGLVAGLWVGGAGLVAIGILALLAWAAARATVYTITDRRVVIRAGVALSVTLNLPFTLVQGAAMRDHGDGTGDVTIAFDSETRVAYLVLWPHARPWRFSRPEPALRCIAAPASVADLLARALAAQAGQGVPVRPLVAADAEGAARPAPGIAVQT